MSQKGSRGVLQVLQEGPENVWGETDEERQCVALAKSTLIEAKEPVEYRIKLLTALIRFERRVASNDTYLENSGEDL